MYCFGVVCNISLSEFILTHASLGPRSWWYRYVSSWSTDPDRLKDLVCHKSDTLNISSILEIRLLSYIISLLLGITQRLEAFWLSRLYFTNVTTALPRRKGSNFSLTTKLVKRDLVTPSHVLFRVITKHNLRMIARATVEFFHQLHYATLYVFMCNIAKKLISRCA